MERKIRQGIFAFRLSAFFPSIWPHSILVDHKYYAVHNDRLFFRGCEGKKISRYFIVFTPRKN